ncbi:MAG TPA: DNA polymerase I [Methylococcaceae bacterium]|nr:DNA polymerase I [Methylococcaceae bacterium]
MTSLTDFKEVWLVDFEYTAPSGAVPEVRCMVALEYFSGRKIRLWIDEIAKLNQPPYNIGKDALFVAYYASAEFNCHLALGWELPCYVLDLFVEFRNTTNGLATPCGAGLVGALTYYGLSSIEAADKASMRELAIRAGHYSNQEKAKLLDYCESDVDALKRLLPVMLPHIDLPRAILRGRYMKAVAQIEHAGIPIDQDTLNRLEMHWKTIQDQLIAEVDQHYGVYEGRTFKAQRFADWLISNNIPWPVLPSSKLDLKDNTFKDMARTFPQIAPLRELRIALSQMRLSELAVGPDDRNRCLLSPFRSRTGRNQPSNTRFIFGPAVWFRCLIKPKQGFGLAYIDWSQQEFGIAAALSNDPLMKEAYSSGDPYLSFAIQAGAVPSDATKKTHKAEREQFKACVLAVQYGMGAESLSLRINQPVIRARELLRLHRDTYRVFWRWSEDGLNYAMLYNKLWTVFGWTLQLNANPNPRSLSNFPMQANGAEMLRLACCLVTEAGITVCAPIHDALLIEAPLDQLDAHIQKTQALMAEASSIVLDGFALRSDVDIVRYPDRYRDERGTQMWETVSRILDDLETQPVRSCTSHLCASAL